MEPYLVLKFLHVALAVLWVGGASILTLLVTILLRRGDDAATMTGVSYVALLGNRVFAPVGLATILSGLVLAGLGGWFWSAWVVVALAIVAGTFVLGAVVLGPSSEKATTTWAEGDLPGAMTIGRRVLRLVALDLGGQWAIIALMTLKPGWADPLMAVPAALVLLGLALALRRPASPSAQPA